MTEGPKCGKSWIADLNRSGDKFEKYSGTMIAGRNCDIFGKTCDAFAHFSVCDSEYELVVVDIQGACAPFVRPSDLAITNLCVRHESRESCIRGTWTG